MASDPVARTDGTLEWRDGAGLLHREGAPARVFPSGREEWYRHGQLHRAGGPAVLHANGSEKWYLHGRRHRDGAPACIYVNGTEKWYRDGLRHRDPEEGPAASTPTGAAGGSWTASRCRRRGAEGAGHAPGEARPPPRRRSTQLLTHRAAG